MKFGILSAIQEHYDFEEVMEFASANGFQCVELACWPVEKAARRYAGVCHLNVEELDAKRCGEIESICRQKKVEISSLAYYPNIMDEDLEKRAFYGEHLKKLIAASAELGIGMVTTFIGRMQHKGVKENLAEMEKVWPPLLRYAESKGVKIGIENCPMLFTEDEWPGGQNLATSPALFREIFARLDSPNLGLNFDPSHFIWQQMDYIRPVYEFRDRLFHVHFKDIKLNPDKLREVGIMALPLQYMEPRIPGMGDVDWNRFIGALTETGYKGTVCLEIEDRAFEGSDEKVKEGILTAARYIRPFLDGRSR